MTTFPLPYVFEVDKTNAYVNRTITFESQKKQKQRVAISKLMTWEISCRGSNADRLVLEAFHDSLSGDATPFYFNDENGVQQTVRFAEGKIKFHLKRDIAGIVQGFEAKMAIELVI